MTHLPITPRTTPRRKIDRLSHEVAAIHAVLDEALVVHLGFVADGQPLVIPVNGWRDGDYLYVHVGVRSRLSALLGAGQTVCATITLMDGLVLARSAMHHSMNFRSVMLFAIPEMVTDADEKARVLASLVEHVVPGRMALVRAPDDGELAATAVYRLPIVEASLKARSGGPEDRPSDLALPVAAGVIPLRLERGEMVAG